MEVIIDDRESGLAEIFSEEDAIIVVKRLDQGDVVIRDGRYELLFERKTYADLWSSVRDGRFREQRSRFLELRNDLQKFIYIIEEGDIRRWDDDVLYECRRTIDRLQIAYDIPVVLTKNIHDTARYLINHFMGEDDLSKFFQRRHGYEDQLRKPKCRSDILKDPEMFLVNLLTIIPRFSYDIAIAITAHLKTKTVHGLFEELSSEQDRSLKDAVYTVRSSGKNHKIGENRIRQLRHILGL